jgi:hypothetical protein
MGNKNPVHPVILSKKYYHLGKSNQSGDPSDERPVIKLKHKARVSFETLAKDKI